MLSRWHEVDKTAVIVCVEYSDLLMATLNYNRHHFSRVLVVTTPQDVATHAVCKSLDAEIFQTTSFYDNGAKFAKYRALEKGLDAAGRSGWIVLIDADVLWPSQIPDWPMCKEHLYTPLRNNFVQFNGDVPPEAEWSKFPKHPWDKEFSGHTQIFHSDCSVLGPAPWHDVSWKHAGGGDSEFQAKWNELNRVRPPFTCLHLGQPGQWTGRVTEINGETPAQAKERREALEQFMRTRRKTRSYEHEKE